MSDIVKRYWWIAAIAAVFVASNAGALSASKKADPRDVNYAAGLCSWCLATTNAKAGPAITPSGPADGVCENCNGRGKVGDGVVMLTCKVCGGTGRTGSHQIAIDKPADDDTSESDQQSEGEPQQAASEYADCSDGSCSSGSVRTRRGVFGGFFRRR